MGTEMATEERTTISRAEEMGTGVVGSCVASVAQEQGLQAATSGPTSEVHPCLDLCLKRPLGNQVA